MPRWKNNNSCIQFIWHDLMTNWILRNDCTSSKFWDYSLLTPQLNESRQSKACRRLCGNQTLNWLVTQLTTVNTRVFQLLKITSWPYFSLYDDYHEENISTLLLMDLPSAHQFSEYYRPISHRSTSQPAYLLRSPNKLSLWVYNCHRSCDTKKTHQLTHFINS